MYTDLASAISHVNAGKLNVIAVSGERRSVLAPYEAEGERCGTVDDPRVQSQLVQRMQRGTIKFDLNTPLDPKGNTGKLDIIAIPDFAAGAMENAGAVTFLGTGLAGIGAAVCRRRKARTVN